MVFRCLIFVLLQILIVVGIKAMDWLFLHKPATPYYKRPLVWGCHLLISGFLLLSVFQLIPNGFRYSAYLLIGLWYIVLTALLLSAGKKMLSLLRISLPFSPIVRRGAAICLFAGLCGYSVHQAYVPQIVHYSVQIDKAVKPFRIGVASDLHLGQLFGNKPLEKLQQIFTQQHVDIVLLPGDMMDDNLTAYFQQNMQPYLAKLSAPFGVYATLGNHDFLQQPAEIAKEIRREGVHLLTDQAVVVANRFIIVGRNDELDLNRQSVASVLASIEAETRRKLPILLMDHRPLSMTENSGAGVDIQVSGHTHRGQIFPFNLLVKLMYELSYGYRQFAQMHTFVTAGYGFWGVPFRLGSQSEVMIIDVSSKESD